MRCADGHDNDDGMHFCGACGLPLRSAVRCANGHDNDNGLRFCGECGVSLNANPRALPPPSGHQTGAEVVEALNLHTGTSADSSALATSPSGPVWSKRSWPIALGVGLVVLVAVGVVLSRGSDDADSDSDRTGGEALPVEVEVEAEALPVEVADDSAELLRWTAYAMTASEASADVITQISDISQDAGSDVLGWINTDFAVPAIEAWSDADSMLAEWNARPQPVPELVAECDALANEVFGATLDVADDFSDMAIEGSSDTVRLEQVVTDLGALGAMADENIACVAALDIP